MEKPIALSIGDASRVSGLGRTYLFEAIAQGKLKARKAGRRTLVEATALESFIANLPLRTARLADSQIARGGAERPSHADHA